MSGRRPMSVREYLKISGKKVNAPALKTLPDYKVDGWVCNRCGRGYGSRQALMIHRQNYCRRR